eukprot:7565863-Pyramimonas_sp.AAC.1
MSGVAILIRDGLDLGVQPLLIPSGCEPARLSGVILEHPGNPKFALCSTYFQAAAGLYRPTSR